MRIYTQGLKTVMGTCLLCFYSCRDEDEKNPVQYIQFIHQCLIKICGEKKLPMQGLKYDGGPEVKCHAHILRCVTYENGEPLQEETTTMRCPTCRKKYDINDLLVSPEQVRY